MLINLDYKLDQSDLKEEKKLSNQEITYNYLSYAVNTKYEKGLEGQLRRMWARIQRKFDEAIDTDKIEIELEQAEKDFLKKCFDDAKFPAVWAKYLDLLEAEIEKFKA